MEDPYTQVEDHVKEHLDLERSQFYQNPLPIVALTLLISLVESMEQILHQVQSAIVLEDRQEEGEAEAEVGKEWQEEIVVLQTLLRVVLCHLQ